MKKKHIQANRVAKKKLALQYDEKCTYSLNQQHSTVCEIAGFFPTRRKKNQKCVIV